MYRISSSSDISSPNSPAIRVSFQSTRAAERNEEDAETLAEIVLSTSREDLSDCEVPLHFNPLLPIDEKKILDHNCFVLTASYLYRFQEIKKPSSSSDKEIDCWNLIALCSFGKEKVYDYILQDMDLSVGSGWLTALQEFFHLCNEKVIENQQGNFPNSVSFGIYLFEKYQNALDDESSTDRIVLLIRFLIRSHLFSTEAMAFYTRQETSEIRLHFATLLFQKHVPDQNLSNQMISALIDTIPSMPKDLTQEPWGIPGKRLMTMVQQGLFEPHSRKTLMNFFWRMMESNIDDWHSLLEIH